MIYKDQFDRLEKKLNSPPRPGHFSLYYEPIYHGDNSNSSHTDLENISWMIHEMKHYLEEKSIDKDFDHGKVNRWLGFIQGVLWTYGITTIEEERKAITEAKNWCRC